MPQLFTLYSSPVADIVRQHNLGVQLYADDSQLYLAFKIFDTTRVVGNVEDCVEKIRSWMIAHKLMMNQEKTIIIQPTRQNDNIFTGTFSISGANIPVAPVARNLGVLRDSRLSMKAHVNQICCASYMHISNISDIRRRLQRHWCMSS